MEDDVPPKCTTSYGDLGAGSHCIALVSLEVDMETGWSWTQGDPLPLPPQGLDCCVSWTFFILRNSPRVEEWVTTWGSHHFGFPEAHAHGNHGNQTSFLVLTQSLAEPCLPPSPALHTFQRSHSGLSLLPLQPGAASPAEDSSGHSRGF